MGAVYLYHKNVKMAIKLNTLFQYLVPKDKKFFPLFNEMTDVLVQIASNLNQAVNAPFEEREALFILIDELEQKEEQLTHKAHLSLSVSFITPFDREDVYTLTKNIDDVAGCIRGAASKIRLYNVEKMTKPIKKLTELNLEASILIREGVKASKNLKKLKTITNACEKINKLEHKSDEIFEKAVFELFEMETDAKKIMKYKEVLSGLEKATDRCKDVANVLETISIKYS
jgi:uncharacterized protein Yka (UPF0111/DUF47 family)